LRLVVQLVKDDLALHGSPPRDPQKFSRFSPIL
jgi:hypothetical protein